MSFDEQPDGDVHGECTAEIHRLERELAEAELRADDAHLSRIAAEEEKELLRAQVEALQQTKRPWTPELTKSVIDGQVKQIDELTEKLRSEWVRHEQEVEALTAARDKYLAGLSQALSEFQSLHERHTESERSAEALRADAERYWWMKSRMTFYNTAEAKGPALQDVCKRIWFHATDDLQYPLDRMIDAARSGAKEAGNG